MCLIQPDIQKPRQREPFALNSGKMPLPVEIDRRFNGLRATRLVNPKTQSSHPVTVLSEPNCHANS